MLSDREAEHMLNEIESILGPQAAEGFDPKQACDLYKKIRPFLEPLPPWLDKLKPWGPPLAKALRLLMLVADHCCGVTS